MKFKRWSVVVLACAALFCAAAVQAQEKLEIFSWWAGDEGPALEALIAKYAALYPKVEVINATVTGGSGVTWLLRLLPPDLSEEPHEVRPQHLLDDPVRVAPRSHEVGDVLHVE